MDQQEVKKSVLIDDEAQNPQFDDETMESNLKIMEKENPSLHAVMMKYKKHHVDQDTTKED